MIKSTSQTCKRDRTRAAIIKAAVQVIADKGLEGASIDELMGAAGMARGTFYNYFSDRDVLWRTVLQELQRAIREDVEARIPQGLPPETVLACMLLGFLQYALDRPSLGWALVRLGTAQGWLMKHELEDQVFPRSDGAVQALLGGLVPFGIGQAFVEGSVNLALRRSLEGHVSLREAELLFGLSLRGLGVEDARVCAALSEARTFAESLRQG